MRVQLRLHAKPKLRFDTVEWSKKPITIHQVKPRVLYTSYCRQAAIFFCRLTDGQQNFMMTLAVFCVHTHVPVSQIYKALQWHASFRSSSMFEKLPGSADQAQTQRRYSRQADAELPLRSPQSWLGTRQLVSADADSPLWDQVS